MWLMLKFEILQLHRYANIEQLVINLLLYNWLKGTCFYEKFDINLIVCTITTRDGGEWKYSFSCRLKSHHLEMFEYLRAIFNLFSLYLPLA